MIAYFDTSALVKLVLQEDGSDEADAIWSDSDAVVCSQLAYAEARAAVAAAVRQGRIRRARHRIVVRGLDAGWGDVSAADVDDEIVDAAGDLADRYALRGADAVHLATALEAQGDDFVFVTWDRALGEAALLAGLPVSPVPQTS